LRYGNSYAAFIYKLKERNIMRQITLSELRSLAENAKDALNQAAANQGRCIKTYYHWSAGHYGQFFDDYHLLIDKDGELYTTTEDLSEIKAATYMRNSGSVAVSLCAAYNSVLGSSVDLGPEPPTEAQLNKMAQVGAVLCNALEVPPDIQHVLTHAEAADNFDGLTTHDPYGPNADCERWDLYVLREGEEGYSGGNNLRGNIVWYQYHPTADMQ
jgi:hypothetical protein